MAYDNGEDKKVCWNCNWSDGVPEGVTCEHEPEPEGLVSGKWVHQYGSCEYFEPEQ